ncbi:radical SAM protein [Neptunicoccus cionae]|uniref:radical SAM protein n=1 Tax=Neptunicoccus cionae TaxID=2035344 RepID=UPI000C779294|nr:radical SAM protein [Amylibacter cionae]PLS20688.1 radical SAM protein [Amylibacter cionae]
MNHQKFDLPDPQPLGKFEHPDITAKGEQRASVALNGATTLWFNTGTLCNIECENCYIFSSPTNDRLVYITRAEVEDYLDQIEARGWPTKEIAFTGGEPFMNPEMVEITAACLERGYEVLILTNAMRPMMRKRVQTGILDLHKAHPGKLTMRISVDHYDRANHDKERGEGSFDLTLKGMEWLRDAGIPMHVAGRTIWGDTDAESRAGYAALYKQYGFDIDPAHPAQTMLFPEMDEMAEVPEITTACWGILNKSPNDVMCASSRMVVKYKGDGHLSVLACTLLPYDPEFNLGRTLEEAEKPVKLNHPHCSKFCVLGGASCSV